MSDEKAFVAEEECIILGTYFILKPGIRRPDVRALSQAIALEHTSVQQARSATFFA